MCGHLIERWFAWAILSTAAQDGRDYAKQQGCKPRLFPAPGVRLINEMCKHSCSNIYSRQDTDSRNAHTHTEQWIRPVSYSQQRDRQRRTERKGYEIIDGSFLFAQKLPEINFIPTLIKKESFLKDQTTWYFFIIIHLLFCLHTLLLPAWMTMTCSILWVSALPMFRIPSLTHGLCFNAHKQPENNAWSRM